jgi:hypothetical protein
MKLHELQSFDPIFDDWYNFVKSQELEPGHYTEQDMVKIFPEAKEIYKENIKKARTILVELHEFKRKVNRKTQNYNLYWFVEYMHTEIDKLIEGVTKDIKRWTFLISNNGKKKEGKITDEDIARAKAVPIESLFPGVLRKSAGRLTGKCPFHEEKTASFVIYEKQNSWWCYGCSEGGSVIDFVMKTQNLKFLDAVKKLIGDMNHDQN